MKSTVYLSSSSQLLKDALLFSGFKLPRCKTASAPGWTWWIWLSITNILIWTFWHFCLCTNHFQYHFAPYLLLELYLSNSQPSSSLTLPTLLCSVLTERVRMGLSEDLWCQSTFVTGFKLTTHLFSIIIPQTVKKTSSPQSRRRKSPHISVLELMSMDLTHRISHINFNLSFHTTWIERVFKTICKSAKPQTPNTPSGMHTFH